MSEPTPNPAPASAELPYAEIPSPPSAATGPAVVGRVVEALAFRFRWATESLRPEDVAFSPCEGAMTLRKLVEHVVFLTDKVRDTVAGPVAGRPDAESLDFPALRARVLGALAEAKAALAGMDEATLASREIEIVPGKIFPVWNMIHGPLADALTHVGQINAWRRISGNPVPKANFFLGRPPRA